ncbi:MAG: hypothetical protein DRP01_03755 [Archaeoglobales archaeon]|nr:MAG: hypothetical protein DRP01_03755 [Archaeoglobales archaeon]
MDSVVENFYGRLESMLSHYGVEILGKELAQKGHPTVQQTFMRMVVAFIKEMAQREELPWEARNRATIRLCKRLYEHVKEERLPLI